MTRVFLADAHPEERSALRLMLQDIKMSVSGESADWIITLAQAAGTHPDMLLVDSDLLPAESGAALDKLRKACPNTTIILLVRQLDARRQTMLSRGVDAFISKNDNPERVAERLRAAARSVRS